MNIVEGELENKEGQSIHYKKFEAEKEEKILLVVHGLGEHSGRYQLFAEYFTEKGYSVYVHDHCGHGRSYGKKGHVDSFEQYASDLDLFVNYVLKNHSLKKVAMIGHSLGGVISSYYAIKEQEKISTLVLSSPGFAPFKTPMKIKDIMGRLLANIVPTLTLANDLDVNFISRDKSIVKAYINDPLVHDRVSTRFYTSFLEAVEKCFNSANLLEIPCMVMVGGADGIVSPEKERDFYRHITYEPKKLIEFPESVHELFNDTNREEVYHIVEDWLEEYGA